MTFEEAVRLSIKTYWEKTDDFDSLETSKGRKYNKKYFDSVESEFLPESDSSKDIIKKEESKPTKSGKMPEPMPNRSGPIPGENYTSDTKNYPWHRPPEITDLDKGVEISAKRLMSDEGSVGIFTMLGTGIDIATVTDMFVTSGIGAGKWTPDFALLLSGPISHIVYLMAKGEGIDADLGIKSKKPTLTKSFFDGIKVDQDNMQIVKDSITPELIQEVQSQTRGFMNAAPPAQAQAPQETQIPEGEV